MLSQQQINGNLRVPRNAPALQGKKAFNSYLIRHYIFLGKGWHWGEGTPEISMKITGWWLNQPWKILVKMRIFPKWGWKWNIFETSAQKTNKSSSKLRPMTSLFAAITSRVQRWKSEVRGPEKGGVSGAEKVWKPPTSPKINMTNGKKNINLEIFLSCIKDCDFPIVVYRIQRVSKTNWTLLHIYIIPFAGSFVGKIICANYILSLNLKGIGGGFP